VTTSESAPPSYATDNVDEDELGLGNVAFAPVGEVAEREHRKTQLAVAFRMFARYGYDEGAAGHITVRDPGRPDHFWVNPFSVPFARIKVSDLLLIDDEGRVIEGERRTNKAAFYIHSSIHRARPDAIAVAHAHTIHGRAFSSLDRELLPIIQESCAFYRNHVVFREYKGLVVERVESERIAESLGQHRAVILRHHGLITLGGSVEETAWWFHTMERACQMQLLAEAAGTPRVMTDEEAVLASRQFGSANMARLGFRLIAEQIVDEEPDVLT
jgi:ribulose-5-phosphate 4-epimerase/fuculose-1-phosphate aldolase